MIGQSRLQKGRWQHVSTCTEDRLPTRTSLSLTRNCHRLSKEAQSCLAGDMQRVAKLVATKADYEVIRELAKLEGPEQTGQDWDER